MSLPDLPCLDEVRVITLPPPQTAAVNRLLREEQGWRLLDVRVTERRAMQDGKDLPTVEPLVIYVMGHCGSETAEASLGAVTHTQTQPEVA